MKYDLDSMISRHARGESVELVLESGNSRASLMDEFSKEFMKVFNKYVGKVESIIGFKKAGDFKNRFKMSESVKVKSKDMENYIHQLDSILTQTYVLSGVVENAPSTPDSIQESIGKILAGDVKVATDIIGSMKGAPSMISNRSKLIGERSGMFKIPSSKKKKRNHSESRWASLSGFDFSPIIDTLIEKNIDFCSIDEGVQVTIDNDRHLNLCHLAIMPYEEQGVSLEYESGSNTALIKKEATTAASMPTSNAQSALNALNADKLNARLLKDGNIKVVVPKDILSSKEKVQKMANDVNKAMSKFKMRVIPQKFGDVQHGKSFRVGPLTSTGTEPKETQAQNPLNFQVGKPTDVSSPQFGTKVVTMDPEVISRTTRLKKKKKPTPKVPLNDSTDQGSPYK